MRTSELDDAAIREALAYAGLDRAPVAQQLEFLEKQAYLKRPLGNAKAHPRKADRGPAKAMKRTPKPVSIREFVYEALDGKRWRWPHHYMLEKDWDATLQDWAASYLKNIGKRRYTKAFHVTSKIVTEKGWFDFVWMGPAGVLFTEHKIRYQDGKANGLSPWQKDFFAVAHGAGVDARVWLWPDDAEDAWVTLTGLPWTECPYALEVAR